VPRNSEGPRAPPPITLNILLINKEKRPTFRANCGVFERNESAWLRFSNANRIVTSSYTAREFNISFYETRFCDLPCKHIICLLLGLNIINLLIKTQNSGAANLGKINILSTFFVYCWLSVGWKGGYTAENNYFKLMFMSWIKKHNFSH
jgi:hypothetical protein